MVVIAFYDMCFDQLLYMHIYIYMYDYTYTHTYIYIYINDDTYTHMFIYIYTLMNYGSDILIFWYKTLQDISTFDEVWWSMCSHDPFFGWQNLSGIPWINWINWLCRWSFLQDLIQCFTNPLHYHDGSSPQDNLSVIVMDDKTRRKARMHVFFYV